MNVNYLISLAFAAFLVTAIGCQAEAPVDQAAPAAPDSEPLGDVESTTASLPGEMPAYTVIDEETYDALIKTQVVLSALVSGNVTSPGLHNLLEHLYQRAIKTPGFQNHSGAVTHVFIYIFTSQEHFDSGAGQWIAMLSKTGADDEKSASVRDELVQQLGRRQEVRFGLTEEVRKIIFARLVAAEDSARIQAEEKYPLDPTQSLDVVSWLAVQVESSGLIL